jgi:hypothetical protein
MTLETFVCGVGHQTSAFDILLLMYEYGNYIVAVWVEQEAYVTSNIRFVPRMYFCSSISCGVTEHNVKRNVGLYKNPFFSAWPSVREINYLGEPGPVVCCSENGNEFSVFVKGE